MVLDMHRDVVADDGASKDSGAPDHAAKQNVVENIERSLDAARKAGTTVLHVHHRRRGRTAARRHEPNVPGSERGTGSTAARAAWRPCRASSRRTATSSIEKERASAFAGTETDIVLRAMAIEKLIITGAWTNFSVESTVRQAPTWATAMVVASDATSSMSEEWHQAAINFASVVCGCALERDRGEAPTRSARRPAMRMRAALFEGVGRPARRASDVDLEEPGPGDVLVRMRAVGVCGSDLHVVRASGCARAHGARPRGRRRRRVGRRGRRRPRARRPRRRLVGARLRRVRPVPARGRTDRLRAAARGHRGGDAARRHDAPLAGRRARLPHDGRGRVCRARA